jgi:putative transposase
MARAPRIDLGNYVYHVINRANARQTLFKRREDYIHFESLLKDAAERLDMRILGYVIMPNHWHLLVYPKHDGDLSVFMQWITLTHTQQYHAKAKTIGYGHLYQGRYRAFLVEKDSYLLAVLKYIERNPVRAKLSTLVQSWQWGSGYRRISGTADSKKLLAELPSALPKNYRSWVNTADKSDDIEAIRHSVNKGKPLGTIDWVERIVKKFGLEMTTRQRGRPIKGT